MSSLERSPLLVGGPWFEELKRGQVFEDAPGLTLTAGHAALHQALIGDRLRLALDAALCREVTGHEQLLAHPNLVCDVSIGQSTGPSQRVRGNLFYRGLVLARPVFIGETLLTRTEIVALKQNRRRPGTPATGLVAMRVRTTDSQGEPVLDFWRCPMIPLRDPSLETGHVDDFADIPEALDVAQVSAALPAGWRLDRLRAAVPGPHHGELEPGQSVHHRSRRDRDRRARAGAPHPQRRRSAHRRDRQHHGQRLVYGGHTISVAAAHATRAMPEDRDDRRLAWLRAPRAGVRG